MSKSIEIKLVKSLIGRKPKHKIIANQLGLRKLNGVTVKPNTPAIRGLINQVSYLVECKEL